jgi:hypothetical protein
MGAEIALNAGDVLQIVVHPGTMTMTVNTRTLRARPVRL